ncbi:MAG: gamma carbonic anhydrase family protein [Gammaproteobacteria bacterium CG11_big_fil_rev_8_21_14_0_20_46_22]|nr:MAG: gamma carbonic anhydrase family protein [Gammaproteobacteria bacterium CG12_big_fil_rev_8_21_14_0_65_46_12]PIR10939.1 MAG: gamma carbonic anhydrase family protein [Gammaproteobacteria bacterium CG11_big_fil_rev_8_21_14_0_20_46_22]
MTIRSFDGKTPRIAITAYIDEASLVLGNVVIGEDSSIWPMTVIRGDVHSIHIGARSNIQDGSVLHVTHDSEYVPGGQALQIGDDVTVGHRVILHACTIGHRCLIGMGSTVLDGAVLEDEVMLGAASLVPPGKVLETGFLYVGAPAKKIRPLTDQEKTFLRYSAESYVQLSKQHASK